MGINIDTNNLGSRLLHEIASLGSLIHYADTVARGISLYVMFTIHSVILIRNTLELAMEDPIMMKITVITIAMILLLAYVFSPPKSVIYAIKELIQFKHQFSHKPCYFRCSMRILAINAFMLVVGIGTLMTLSYIVLYGSITIDTLMYSWVITSLPFLIYILIWFIIHLQLRKKNSIRMLDLREAFLICGVIMEKLIDDNVNKKVILDFLEMIHVSTALKHAFHKLKRSISFRRYAELIDTNKLIDNLFLAILLSSSSVFHNLITRLTILLKNLSKNSLESFATLGSIVECLKWISFELLKRNTLREWIDRHKWEILIISFPSIVSHILNYVQLLVHVPWPLSFAFMLPILAIMVPYVIRKIMLTLSTHKLFVALMSDLMYLVKKVS